MRQRTLGELILSGVVLVAALVLGFVLFGVFLVVLLVGGVTSYVLGRKRRRPAGRPGVIDVDYTIE